MLDGNLMFTPDRGRLDEIHTVRENAVVELAGRQIRCTRYDILLRDGQKKYEVDVDSRGTVVQFVLFNSDGSVTFSLDG